MIFSEFSNITVGDRNVKKIILKEQQIYPKYKIISDSLSVHLDATKGVDFENNVWTDLSGNGNNATLVSVTGYYNNYFELKSLNNDYIKLLNTVLFTTGTTIQVLIDFSRVSGIEYFLGHAERAATGIRYNNIDFLIYSREVKGYTTLNWDKVTEPVLFTCRKPQEDKFEIFINTNLIGSIIYNVNSVPINLIGRRFDWYYSNIDIYSFLFYNKILTESEIANNYNYLIKP